MQEPTDAFRRAGILLYAMGVGDAVSAELKEISSSPVEKFVAFVPNFSGLGSFALKLCQELCDTLAKAAPPVGHVSPGTKDFSLFISDLEVTELKDLSLILPIYPFHMCACLIN